MYCHPKDCHNPPPPAELAERESTPCPAVWDGLPVLDSWIRGSKVAVRGRLPSWAWLDPSTKEAPTFPRKISFGVRSLGTGEALDPCPATEVWSGESLVWVVRFSENDGR